MFVIIRYNPLQDVGPDVGLTVAGLTDLQARRISPSSKPLPEGTVKGLRLFPGAEKGHGKWIKRFVSPTIGKRRDMGLGSYPETGIKEARQKALDAGRLIEAGIDPIEAREAARKSEKPLPLFCDIAALVIADAQASPSTRRSATNGSDTLGRYTPASYLIGQCTKSRRSTWRRSCGLSGERNPRSRASSIPPFGASSNVPASFSGTNTA